MRQRLCVSVMGVFLLLTGSCGAPADSSAGRGSDNPPEIKDLCGTRTVQTVPPPGVLRSASQSTVELSPSASGLAKVISIIRGLSSCQEQPGEEIVVFDSGEDGLILSINGEPATGGQRFIVADGCLQIQGHTGDSGEGDAGDDEGSDGDDGADNPRVDPGPCGETGFPLFQKLNSNNPEKDPYVCIDIREGDSCQDCSEDAGGWTFTTRTTITFQARGNLSGVQTVDLCTLRIEDVNLRIGETVRVTLISTTRFEPQADGS